jgi:hypothetical protein
MNETYGNGGFFGGGEFLAFLIFAIIFGGGWGFGGGFNRGGGMSGAGAVIADNGIQSQLASIQDQISTNKIENSLGQMQNTMVQGFSGLNTGISNGFAAITNTTNQGFAGLNSVITNGFAAAALQNNQNTQSIINAICGLSSKIDANTIAELSAQNAALKADVSNARQTASFTEQLNALAAQIAACCCKISSTAS